MTATNTLTIRKVPDAVHRALKVRAAQNGRSTEAEVRAILETAVAPATNLADALLDIRKSLGSVELNIVRDKRPVKVEPLL
jgi:plasmid stability protein